MDTIKQLSADLNAVKAKTGKMPAVHYVDEPVLLRLKKELGHARGSQRNSAKVLGVPIKAFQFVQTRHKQDGSRTYYTGMSPEEIVAAIFGGGVVGSVRYRAPMRFMGTPDCICGCSHRFRGVRLVELLHPSNPHHVLAVDSFGVRSGTGIVMGKGCQPFRAIRGNELFCTRGQHWCSAEGFPKRKSRRKLNIEQSPTLFMPWCRDCKRLYDRGVAMRARQGYEQRQNPGCAP